MSIAVKNLKRDEKTGATASLLQFNRFRIELPNKSVTTSEISADKLAGTELRATPDLAVVARLIYPETLKKLLGDESYFKEFSRRLSREGLLSGDSARLLFLVMKGDAEIDKAEDLKTLLDLQYFSGMDFVTVQQQRKMPIEDFIAFLKFARRWIEERGVEKPLIPVLAPADSKESAEKNIESATKMCADAIAIDLMGGFPYYTLRAIQALKSKRPESWVHAFQVPPKVRLGRSLHSCSEGMILPYFSVDSFSRWVVPPPPVPLVKEKINVFDRRGWGALKRKDYLEMRKGTLGCKCSLCRERDLDGFYDGTVQTVLARAKVHDHLSQKDELSLSRKSIREGEYKELLASKEYPRALMPTLENIGLTNSA